MSHVNDPMATQAPPPLFANSNSSNPTIEAKGFDVVHGHTPIPAWPRCPGCGAASLAGHITCGRVACNEGVRRRGIKIPPVGLVQPNAEAPPCGPTCCKPTCDEPAHRRAACERADKAFDCVGLALFKVSYAIEVTFRAVDLHPPAGSPIAETTLAQAEEVLAKLINLWHSAAEFRHDIRERGGL